MLLLDARYLAQTRSGIPRYTLNLMRALRAAAYPETLGVLIPPGCTIPGDLASASTFDFIDEPNAPRSPGEPLRWARRLRRHGAAALHCPDAFGPLTATVPVAITLHDVIPLIRSGDRPRSRKQRLLPLWRAWLRRQCKAAHTVVTVSRCSADDIASRLGVDRANIEVIPNAVPAPDSSTPPASDGDTLRRLGVTPPFVLHVGRFDPYKNIPGLIDAFGRLTRDPGRPERLVLVGAPDPRFPEALRRAAQIGLRGRVVFTGEIDDDALHALYRHASLLVMPGLYEGFGLPAVEAMHAGVPVLASDRGALPEVVGEAATLVDAADPAALAEAMRRVLDDAPLRATLTRHGHARVSLYDPAVIGRRYAALYDRLAAASRAR